MSEGTHPELFYKEPELLQLHLFSRKPQPDEKGQNLDCKLSDFPPLFSYKYQVPYHNHLDRNGWMLIIPEPGSKKYLFGLSDLLQKSLGFILVSVLYPMSS